MSPLARSNEASGEAFPHTHAPETSLASVSPSSTLSMHSASTEAQAKASSSLVANAGVVGLGTLASRGAGLARDLAVAALFDRSQTDAFWVAFTIPNALRQLLGEGAVSSAVVPILSAKIATEGAPSAQAFFAKARAASWIVLVAVCIIGVLGARWLTEAFASGFHAHEGQFERTHLLTQIVFPYVLFMGTAAMGMAALTSRGRFAVASFSPALVNVGVIAAAWALPRPFAARGWDPTLALGVGVLVGGMMHVIAQWPSLRAIGFASRPVFDWRDRAIWQMGARLGPLTVGLALSAWVTVISRAALSGLGEGAQSYFAWATRVCDVPQGIFVMALSTAALPSLSALCAVNDKRGFADAFTHGLRLSMFVAIPASVVLAVLAEPLVVLLFQRGQFDAHAARETARAVAWQGGATFAVAAVRHLVPALYALGDTRSPVVVSAVDSAAFVLIIYGCGARWGHVGVSVAMAGSTCVQMVALLVVVQRKIQLGKSDLWPVAWSCTKTAGASGASAALAWLALYRGWHWGQGSKASALCTVLALVLFCALYIFFGICAKSEELSDVRRALVRRFARRRPA